jgi:hypothetical protein
MENLIHAVGVLMYVGQDPNELLFNRVGCPDIGLECGGWGKIVMEVSVVDHKRD